MVGKRYFAFFKRPFCVPYLLSSLLFILLVVSEIARNPLYLRDYQHNEREKNNNRMFLFFLNGFCFVFWVRVCRTHENHKGIIK